MDVGSGERKRRYSKQDIMDIILHERITREDCTYLCALSPHGMVLDTYVEGVSSLVGMKSISVIVIETEDYITGYFSEPGAEPIIVMNENISVLDYDFISQLHPVHDYEIYLWLTQPWDIEDIVDGMEIDSLVGNLGEWYRRDVYKDGIMPYDGKLLGWADTNADGSEEHE